MTVVKRVSGGGACALGGRRPSFWDVDRFNVFVVLPAGSSSGAPGGGDRRARVVW